MTRLLHPPERGLHRQTNDFDPVVAGERYRLTAELSLAIWKRACADVTDSAGRQDDERAQRRFHELAARISARGSRLRRDVGRVTRVETELLGIEVEPTVAEQLAVQPPGRDTQVARDLRRWAEIDRAAGIEPAIAGQPSELPGASDVAQAMAALQVPTAAVLSDAASPAGEIIWPRPAAEPARPRGPAVQSFAAATATAAQRAQQIAADAGLGAAAVAQPSNRMSALFGGAARATSTEATPARLAAHAQAGEMQAQNASRELEQMLAVAAHSAPGAPLPGELTARMKAEFGGEDAAARHDSQTRSLRDELAGALGFSSGQVEVQVNETARQKTTAREARGLMEDGRIYLHPDRYAPATADGRKLIAHEMVHVAQAALPRSDTLATSLAAEAEASYLAEQFARGSGMTRPTVALPRGAAAADNGKDQELRGKPVKELGVVYKEEGVKLRDKPTSGPASKVKKLLPFNTRMFVDSEDNSHYFVTTNNGDFGYVAMSHVKIKPPEPNAKIYHIKSGDNALKISQMHYGGNARWGADHRFFVNGLVFVNQGQGLRGIYKPDANADWDATKVREEYVIWIPSLTFMRSLQGKVSSGSISHAAWKAAKQSAAAIAEFTIGGAAFIGGLLHGALESLWDVLVGLKDLLVMAWDILKSLFTGNLLNDAQGLWNNLVTLDWNKLVQGWIDNFQARWNHPNILTKWHFRGWVFGYAIAEVVMLVFSGGIIQGIKWAGKSAKVAKIVQSIPRIAKFTETAKKSKLAQKLISGLRKKSIPKKGWGIPEGGVPIESRLGKKGVSVPEYAKKNPQSYYYDPKTGKYPRRTGFPMDEAAGIKIPCFPAGTLVATPDGPCGIDRIMPGQLVFAYQEQTREVVARRVLEVHVSSADWLHRIATNGAAVLATGDHLFWIGPSEFRAARDLAPRVALRSMEGRRPEIVSIEAIYTGTQSTYNLSVDADFTYFVGPEGLLVHNDGPFGVYIGRDPRTNEIVYAGLTEQDLLSRQGQHQREARLKPEKHGGKTGMKLEWARSPDGKLLTNLSKDEAHFWERKVYDREIARGAKLANRQIPYTDENMAALIKKHCPK